MGMGKPETTFLKLEAKEGRPRLVSYACRDMADHVHRAGQQFPLG